MQENSWMDDDTFNVNEANKYDRLDLLELLLDVTQEREVALRMGDDQTFARKKGQITWLHQRLGIIKEAAKMERLRKERQPEKDKRKKEFLEFFFRAAQATLPRHDFKRLTLDAQRRARGYRKDTMPKDEEDFTQDEVVTLVLGPILADLIEKHGIDRARILFKEAVRRAGLDPDCADLQFAKPILS